ncbi:MAG: hypothetical protein IPL27_21030 [Lewinellaceae bacterium]|nr:hypothetical protein [Lewinellaceae bacterium]
MKVLIPLFLAFFAMLPFGLIAQNPVGAWKMSVPDENGKMTPLKVDISADGTYAVDFGADGTIENKGKYTLDGGKMTIQDTEGSDCTAQGVYTLKIEGDTLTMTRVSDGCANRGGPEGVMTMQRG